MATPVAFRVHFSQVFSLVFDVVPSGLSLGRLQIRFRLWVLPSVPVDNGGHTLSVLGSITRLSGYDGRYIRLSVPRNGWVPLIWQRQLPFECTFPSVLACFRRNAVWPVAWAPTDPFSGVGASEPSSRWTGLPRGSRARSVRACPFPSLPNGSGGCANLWKFSGLSC